MKSIIPNLYNYIKSNKIKSIQDITNICNINIICNNNRNKIKLMHYNSFMHIALF